MSIKNHISDDLKNAMRSRDKDKINALRFIMAAIKQIEVDERITVDDTRLLVILGKLVKQHNESITQFRSAGRDDLLLQEQFGLDTIKQYLPMPLSAQEIEDLITAAIELHHADKIADMGKVMAELKPRLQGRCDLGQVSLLVKNKLG